jgi:hypothetical protein
MKKPLLILLFIACLTLSMLPALPASAQGGGSISGVVENEAGVPLVGALVCALELSSTGPWVSTLTGVDGSYSIPDLPSGSYWVEASAPGHTREFYDGAYIVDCWDAVTAVPVSAPDDTPGIDFVLEEAGIIRGTVLDTGGAPVEDAKVGAANPDSPFCGLAFTPAANGTYAIPGLPSGSYIVHARASGYAYEAYDDVHHPDLATLVRVVGGATAGGIDFALEPGGNISGSVISEGGGPIEGATVYLSDFGDPEPFVSTSTTEDGTYTLSGLPSSDDMPSGGYMVWASAPGHQTEWYDGASGPGAATPVSVVPPQETTGIDFSLALIIPGDANGDGNVNMQDVTYTELIILGYFDPTPGADANGDGSINMGDVTTIELMILGYL